MFDDLEMPDKEIFVLKIVWKKSIASLQRLTQAVQHTNLRRTAGDPTWVWIVTEIEGDGIESRLSSWNFFTLICNHLLKLMKQYDAIMD